MEKIFIDPLTGKQFIVKFVNAQGEEGVFLPLWVKSPPESWEEVI